VSIGDKIGQEGEVRASAKRNTERNLLTKKQRIIEEDGEAIERAGKGSETMLIEDAEARNGVEAR